MSDIVERLNRIAKQIWRGCGWMPHVGEHPGTGMCVGLTITTGLAGAQKGGFIGFAVAATAGTLIYVPFYLYGAYSRAELSDGLERRSLMEKPE